GDRDEAPVAAVGQRRPGVLGQQERTGEQQRDERVPAVLGELGDRRGVLDAGAVAVGLEVDAEHVVAVGDEALGDRPADAARRPRDDRDPAHGTSSSPPVTRCLLVKARTRAVMRRRAYEAAASPRRGRARERSAARWAAARSARSAATWSRRTAATSALGKN